MKVVVFLIMAVLIALPVTAEEPSEERGIPLTAITPEMMNTLFSWENVQKRYTNFMETFLEKNKACKRQFQINDANTSTLTSCGSCCEFEYGKIKPKDKDWTHPCMFPKTCAEEMEGEYCWLNVMRGRLAQFCPNEPRFQSKLGQVFKKLQ